MPESVTPLSAVGVVIVLFIVLLSALTNNCSLNGIKSKTVGDGQHGTARWATAQEVKKTFANVPFDVASWRAGKNLPEVQGLILGSTQRGKQLDALVDCDDVHCLMIGASGVGKTAFFLYPNLEFACASGMSYLALDTKGGATRCNTRSALQALWNLPHRNVKNCSIELDGEIPSLYKTNGEDGIAGAGTSANTPICGW